MHLLISNFFSSLSCLLKSWYTLQTRANEVIHIPTEKCLCICNVTEVELLSCCSCNIKDFKPSLRKHHCVFCCYRNYSKKQKLQKNKEFFCEPFTHQLPHYLNNESVTTESVFQIFLDNNYQKQQYVCLICVELTSPRTAHVTLEGQFNLRTWT